MELRALWKVARRRWWLIALPSLAALAYATYGYATSPAGSVSYSTQIRYTAATPPDDERPTYEDESYYPWLASEYVVNALTDWVRTGSFAEEVSKQLAEQNIDIPAGALQGRIAADNARSVMTLTLNWGDADQLAAIAEAATYVLQERSAVYFPPLSAVGVQVVALDAVSVSPIPPPISARLDPLIRFALGAGAGVGLAFLVEYLDPTLRDRSEIEALGLAVLAEIPRS